MTPSAPTTREAYDQLLETLVGCRVLRVLYFEVDYDQTEPHWDDDSPSFDSLDFGLELHLDDGDVFSFKWGSEFASFGLALGRARMRVSGPVRSWDVTERWATVLTGPVREASCTWAERAAARKFQEPCAMYPQNVTLRCEPVGVVVIAAFQFDNGLYVGADHITVFFDEAEAHQLTGPGKIGSC